MFTIVEMPIWLLVLILLFAAVTASTHLLFPSVRWFFRRRAERLVAKLNERLDRPIQPFKLLSRQDMIQRVIYDPGVMREVAAYAQAEEVREDVAFEKARDYAREIVPSFSATAYFGFAIKASRFVARWIFDVRLNHVDEAALSGIDQEATVVYVMNHRSNFDYVLVTYLAAKQSALSYAVGEWARIWPLSRLIRSMGAYFIRRRTRNALYRKVLATYVQRATEAGVTQAVFPEGGLSRSGAVAPPKLGILSYIVDGWQGDAARDVVFVPVALNYDRVVEDRVLVAAGRTGQRQFRGSIFEGMRFAVRYFLRRVTGKVDRFGVAAVTFGRPVSLADLSPAPGDLVPGLASQLTDTIRNIMPITTVPLIAVTLLRLGRGATVDEILAGMAQARVDLGKSAADESLRERADLERQLDILVLREILSKDGEAYAIADEELVTFYASSIGGLGEVAGLSVGADKATKS